MVASDFKTKILPASKKLHRFATHFLGDEDEAKDVVQDVFLKLWQKKETLSGVENIEAFAMQMTKNRCLDVIRERKGKQVVTSEKVIKSDNTDVHVQIELSESAGLIKKLVNTLPELQRKIMQLRDIEQFSYDEIAEMTDLQMNAIRTNLSRARKKVRDEFLKMNDHGNHENKSITAEIF